MTIRFDPAGSHALGSLADARWRPMPRAVLSAARKDWLTRGGSLTRHLGSLGSVRLKVVDERVDQAWADELASLGLSARTPVWVREVLLCVDDVAMVAAHSIVTLQASRGIWQAMRSLGTRPLAELLYADRTVERSVLVSRRLTARHPLHRYATRWAGATTPALVARRSIFVRAHAPLLVTECMLPALWDKLADRQQELAASLHGSPGISSVRGDMRSVRLSVEMPESLAR